MRYIDDVFCIWDGSEDAMQSFLKQLNDGQMKFTCNLDCPVNFLDVTIEKLSTTRGDVFSTRCYRKPQLSPMYLQSTSAHSQSTKRGMVYSEIRRIIKVSSTQHSRYNALSQLTIDLLERGYKRRWIDKIMDKFATVSRAEVLSAQPERPKKAACVTTYHPALASLSRRMVEAFKMCKTHGKQPIVYFKTHQTLKNMLVRSKFNMSEESGELRDEQHNKCAQCKRARCKCCALINEIKTFHSNETKLEY
ncbi:hypothetical protein GJ496_010693 [Pomphorhynchus laevis]|nr:hypothetical protein GJ496_010693 [Pomphorhynchus laevis]